MGSIRFFLAVSVVIFHSFRPVWDLTMAHGFTAVRLFFIISGFYMAMILNGKYTQYSSFMVNRLLKLFPAYWAVLALCVLFSASKLAGLAPGWWGFYFVTNIFMVGSHFTSALIEQSGQIGVLPFGAPLTGPEMTWKYLYIGPVWSLSVELLFYMVAPFLLTRPHFKYKMAGMLAVSAAACAFLTIKNSWTTPWSYNFLLPNLFYFMLGAIAYRFYDSSLFQKINSKPLMVSAVALQLAYIILYQYVPENINLRLLNISLDKPALGVLLCFVATPFAFELTKANRIDRFLGDLSYPIYISHFLFIMYFPYFRSLHPLIGSIALAVVLDLTLIKTLDKYRARLVR